FTSRDGAVPLSGLIRDAAGNLYGTAVSGGYLCSCGVVFELSPTSTGGWKETVLHSFTGGADGYSPFAPLVFDGAGNLYGTTAFGGSRTTACGSGCGVVFRLTPTSGGLWKERVLYSFSGADGAFPYSGATFDALGNLYGETYSGLGAGSRGTVFRLSPTSSGPWTETILHGFSGDDVSYPGGGLVFDKAGNLYGTTQGTASSSNCPPSCGSAFELSPNSDGTWTETILHAFTGGVDGAAPYAGLVLDGSGNLRGTTIAGGAYNKGAVFELTPSSGGSWNFNLVYSFTGGLYSGEGPQAGLILDASGNLFGTAGGGPSGDGVVYEIKP
ncbi:MAG TPA: choice-of-anchor tandem repeat GloVer-containing protein, partial [Candidatus Sulfotelmatobacter sp.]